MVGRGRWFLWCSYWPSIRSLLSSSPLVWDDAATIPQRRWGWLKKNCEDVRFAPFIRNRKCRPCCLPLMREAFPRQLISQLWCEPQELVACCYLVLVTDSTVLPWVICRIYAMWYFSGCCCHTRWFTSLCTTYMSHQAEQQRAQNTALRDSRVHGNGFKEDCGKAYVLVSVWYRAEASPVWFWHSPTPPALCALCSNLIIIR